MRHKLTAAKCEKVKKPGRYSDGDGLYLWVRPDGGKYWIFRYRKKTDGKLNDRGLGRYGLNGGKDVTLSEARTKAEECRADLAANRDPVAAARKRRQQAFLDQARDVTFGWCAEQYIKAHSAGWKNKKHTDQWRNTLDTHAKKLKHLPVAEIDTPLVLSCLKPIWETKPETASRLRGRIEATLGWATVSGYREGDNPARWKGHLATILPKPEAVKRELRKNGKGAPKHHPALHYQRIGDFMARLRNVDTVTARALEFLILTAAREGEVVSTVESSGLPWSEIDLQAKTWTIPAERMKAEREHVVPLSPRAIEILKAQPRVGDFVFPGRSLKKSISGAALLKLVKKLEPGTTVHGLRSTFRDWAGETTAYPRDVIEKALAHQLKDKAEAAYARGNLLAKRRRLMKDWADYCTTGSASTGNVTAIRAKGAA